MQLGKQFTKVCSLFFGTLTLAAISSRLRHLQSIWRTQNTELSLSSVDLLGADEDYPLSFERLIESKSFLQQLSGVSTEIEADVGLRVTIVAADLSPLRVR